MEYRRRRLSSSLDDDIQINKILTRNNSKENNLKPNNNYIFDIYFRLFTQKIYNVIKLIIPCHRK
jgi:hypothetical protein